MHRIIRAATLAAALLGGAVAAQAEAVPYDGSFRGLEMRWNGSGTTTVFYSVRRDGQSAVVCGFYFSEGRVPEHHARALLRRSMIRADRTTVMRNISHFTRIDADTAPEQVRAACKPSRAAWRADFASTRTELHPPVGSFH